VAKVRIIASQEAFDSRKEDSGDFVVPKPGIYTLQCTECEPGFTKDSDGDEDKSKPYLKFTYKIVGVGVKEEEPKENYGNTWDYMSFSESSDWKRAEVLLAYGIASGGFDGELDTDEAFLNRKIIARLKHEKSRSKDDPKQAKVGRMFQYGTDMNVAETEVEYGDADEAVDDTFGPHGDEAVEAEHEEQSRKEELEGMELKALGGVLTELGGDPKDAIVKGKDGKTDPVATKAAVIGAILAAEEGETGNTEDDDDDPF
jgi:hypothetical protein